MPYRPLRMMRERLNSRCLTNAGKGCSMMTRTVLLAASAIAGEIAPDGFSLRTGRSTAKRLRTIHGESRGTGPAIKSPGRRGMRALLKAREVVTGATTHPNGNRDKRRVALKQSRTLARRISRAHESMSPAMIEVVNTRIAERARIAALADQARVGR